mmetsp:Transcript_4136/g.10006  ORF Transcript_4136/g.10006 Transcript_4136/m.10006 type:complete len:137 (-) Transcript_4136:13-423(-)
MIGAVGCPKYRSQEIASMANSSFKKVFFPHPTIVTNVYTCKSCFFNTDSSFPECTEQIRTLALEEGLLSQPSGRASLKAGRCSQDDGGTEARMPSNAFFAIRENWKQKVDRTFIAATSTRVNKNFRDLDILQHFNP